MRLPAWMRSARVLIGLAIVLFVGLTALFAPLLAPHDPNEQNLISILLPPAWLPGGEAEFPLGTDSLGRCVLSRLIYGARVAMTVAVVASFGAMLLGGVLAHVAGYFGGRIDWLIGRIVDVWMSFPPVILSLILMVGLGTGLRNVILAIILVDWTRFCRVLRSEVLVVHAARLCDGGAADRLLALAHHHARDPAGDRAVADHADEPRNGHRGDRRGDSVVRRHERQRRYAGLGPDDRRRAAVRLSVVLEPDFSDPRDLRHGVRLQSARRRPAPHARRAAHRRRRT